jgi:hypothetical protein
LHGRPLQDLGHLIGVDDLGSNKLVKGLVRVVGNEGVGLGGMGLGRYSQRRVSAEPGGEMVVAYDLLVHIPNIPVGEGWVSGLFGHKP